MRPGQSRAALVAFMPGTPKFPDDAVTISFSAGSPGARSSRVLYVPMDCQYSYGTRSMTGLRGSSGAHAGRKETQGRVNESQW